MNLEYFVSLSSNRIPSTYSLLLCCFSFCSCYVIMKTFLQVQSSLQNAVRILSTSIFYWYHFAMATTSLNSAYLTLHYLSLCLCFLTFSLFFSSLSFISSFLRSFLSFHYQTAPSTYRSYAEFLGTPGGGAPLRTRSGNIKTNVIGDLLIRFQERDRQAVEERFRYNQDRAEQERYSQELSRCLSYWNH